VIFIVENFGNITIFFIVKLSITPGDVSKEKEGLGSANCEV